MTRPQPLSETGAYLRQQAENERYEDERRQDRLADYTPEPEIRLARASPERVREIAAMDPRAAALAQRELLDEGGG